MVPDPKIKPMHPRIKYIQRKYIQAWPGMVVSEGTTLQPLTSDLLGEK